MDFSLYVVGDHLDLRGVHYIDHEKLQEFLESEEASKTVRIISLSPQLISHSGDLSAVFSVLYTDYLESINLVTKEGSGESICNADFGELRSSLRRWKNIRSINIRGNRSITEDALVKLFLFKGAPGLVSLDISGVDSIGGIYSSLCSLKNLSNLYLRGTLTKRGSLKALVESGCITKLTCLDLSKNGISSQDLTALVNSDHIERLTHLYLNDNNIDDLGLKLLAQSKHLIKLTNLNLSNNAIGFLDVNSLHNSNLKSLTSIDLSRNSKGRRVSLCAISLDIDYRNVTSLNLSFSFLITIDVIKYLFHKDNLENLDFLDLSGNSIKDEAMEALAGSMIKQLRQLNLNECSIADKDLAILGNSSWIKNVSHLALSNNKLNLLAFNILIKCQGFEGLTFLDLSGIRSHKVKEALTQGNIKNVTSLILANSSIDDDLLKTLVDSLDLKRLISIDLMNTRVSFSCIKGLIKSHFTSLLSLSLSFESCTFEEMRSNVASLSEVIAERLTVTFRCHPPGQGDNEFRTIVSGSGGRLHDNNSIVQQENDSFFNPGNLLNVINSDESALTGSVRRSKDAIVPSIVVSQNQSVFPDDDLRVASQSLQTETDTHLQVRNKSRSRGFCSFSNSSVTFINKRTTVKYRFFADGISDNVILSNWIRSSCKAFPIDVPLAENKTAFGLSSSILDLNCLKLFTDENLGSLVEIVLVYCKIGDEGVKFLAENLPTSFTTITIKHCDVTYVGVSYLFKKGLSYIDASHCSDALTLDSSAQHDSLPPLSQSVTFAVGSRFIFKNMLIPGGEFKKYFLSGDVDLHGVVQLNLEKNFINADDLLALSQKNVSNLAKLDLTSNGLNDECAAVLKNCSFPGSMELNLGNNNIGNDGLRSLLTADFFEKLAVLRMNNNRFNYKGWEISKRLTFQSLQYLNLSDNSIGPKGGEFVASHKYSRLEKLYFSNADLGDEGVKFLKENSFPLLALAVLNSNNIGDAGAISLANAMWPRLVKLTLDGNPIGCSGVLAFARRNSQRPKELSLGVLPGIPSEYIGGLFRSNFEVLSIKAVNKYPDDTEVYENSVPIDNDKEITFSANSKFLCLNTLMPGGSFARYFLHGRIDCGGITRLDLSGNTLSNDDICAFDTSNMKQLDTLILKNTDINDESLEKLSNISFMRIKEVDLSDNSISGQGAFEALSNCSWKSTVKIFLFNNKSINEDHKIRIKNSCGFSVFFDLKYDEYCVSYRSNSSYGSSCGSSRSSLGEWSNDSIFNLQLNNLRTSSPNLSPLPARSIRKGVSSTGNDDSIYISSVSKDVASEIPASADSGKEGIGIGNTQMNNDNSSENTIHFLVECASAVHQKLPSGTSGVGENQVCNNVTLSRKRARVEDQSPSRQKTKHLKIDDRNFIPIGTEKERLGPGNFSGLRSILTDSRASSVSGCSKSKNGG